MISLDNAVAGRTPWYMRPREAQMKMVDAAPPALRESVAQFVEDGFVVVREAISEEMRQEALSAFNALVTRNAENFDGVADEHGHYVRLVNLHLVLEEFRRCYFENKALPLVEYLFQARPSLYTSLYFQRGSTQPIHRDSPFFTTSPRNYFLGFWVALEAANSENGALSVVRGGHLRKELDLEALARSKYSAPSKVEPFDMEMWDKYQSGVIDEYRTAGDREELLDVRACDTVIWHPMLPHGGSPIGSPGRTRHSLVVHTTPSGVPVHYMDAFYDEKNPRPEEAAWEYERFEAGDMVAHGQIDLGHSRVIPISDVK